MAAGSRINAVIDWEIWSLGDLRIDAGWFLINCDPDTYRRVPGSAGTVPPVAELAEIYQDELGPRPPTGLVQRAGVLQVGGDVVADRQAQQPKTYTASRIGGHGGNPPAVAGKPGRCWITGHPVLGTELAWVIPASHSDATPVLVRRLIIVGRDGHQGRELYLPFVDRRMPGCWTGSGEASAMPVPPVRAATAIDIPSSRAAHQQIIIAALSAVCPNRRQLSLILPSPPISHKSHKYTTTVFGRPANFATRDGKWVRCRP